MAVPNSSSTRAAAQGEVSEENFMKNPFAPQFLHYARCLNASRVNRIQLKWHPGRTGMSLDDFVYDASVYGMELAIIDYGNGLFRNENKDSFRKFLYGRIKKAFYEKLKELGNNSGTAVFDERLAKYYEGTAVDFGPTDENDDPIVNELSISADAMADGDEDNGDEEGTEAQKKEKRVTHRARKKPNEDVILYYYSAEKAEILNEVYETKMRYAKKIMDIVAGMSETDQQLFKLKFQIDFKKKDYRMWKRINAEKHCKDPFTRMAHEKYGFSVDYARKRICLIKSFILERLERAGYTPESYEEETSFPLVMEFLTTKPQREPEPSFDLNVEELSEADCRDILMELFS